MTRDIIWSGNRARRPLTIAAVLIGWCSPGAAWAGCDPSAFGERFTEAARLCGNPALPGAKAPLPTAAAIPVIVPDTPAAVSISMPGYRQRLVAAAAQVNRTSAAPTDALIAAVGRRYRIDPHLLASIVRAESAGRLDAVSHKGALGLMQVMPATARSMGVREPERLLTDRALALSTGAAYLKQLQRQFGNNVPLVVAAYNAGPGAVVRYKGVPRYRETRGYVSQVMGRYAAARSGVTRPGTAR